MISPTHIDLWNQSLAIIKDNVREEAYTTWFVPIVPLSFDGQSLCIQVPSHFFFEYLEEKYIDLLQKVIYRVYGQGVVLKYKILVVKETKTTVTQPSAHRPATSDNYHKPVSTTVPSPFEQRVFDDLASQLNPNYTFFNYYTGNSNKLACSAGNQVAENPGKTAFNPLFVYGESGVGKTHLMQAIGNLVKEKNPRARVLYLSSHLFQVQYTNAVRNNCVNDFINFYQSLDVLLLDDTQELVNWPKTQNTFFHIFNHLHQTGKQLVLSADRPPRMLEELVPRLLTRFKWGLTAEIARPDYDLRRNILVNKVRNDGLSISEDVIDFVARNATESVRDLEGIIVSLMAHATVFNREVTLSLAERVLSNAVAFERKQITVDTIISSVCAYYELDIKMLQVKSRKREIVQARQVSMFLTKKYTDLSLARIGEMIGKKDHATVLHACKTINEQIEVDRQFRTHIEEIESALKR